MTNPSSRDDFLDVTQAAAWLNITVRHVRRLVFENRIPNHKIGGLVRLRRTEILDWLDGNERGPTRPTDPARSELGDRPPGVPGRATPSERTTWSAPRRTAANGTRRTAPGRSRHA